MIDNIKIIMAILILFGESLLPSFVGAAIDGSPHDLISQKYVHLGMYQKLERCIFCHLPVKEGEQIPNYAVPPSVSYYSESGLVCFSCHDGTTIVSKNVDGTQGSFHPKAHPLKTGNALSPKYKPGQHELYIKENKLECITCHSPHDNTMRPFLRVELIELCSICHEKLENVGYGIENLSGNHPIHETLGDDSGKKTPIVPQAPFLVPFPEKYPLHGGRDHPGVHWQRGGHLHGGYEGTLECFTCHNVHGTDKDAPSWKLLTIPPVRKTADEFCEGCHRGQRSDDLETPHFPNPGGTTTPRTYHPCDDDLGNGPGYIVNIRQGVTWPFGEGSPLRILCTTCHVAHGGMEKSPALRRPVYSKSFCEECHLTEVKPYHHPVNTSAVSERICLTVPPDFTAMEFTGGEMSCSSCHVAHNAGLGKKEEEHVPILDKNYHESSFCLECHPEDNVTCIEDDRGTASHFLGNPTIPETYEDGNPPLKTDEWPITGLMSIYGGDKEKEVICLSCHVFKAGATGEVLPYHLQAFAGEDAEWEEDQNPGVYLCTGCHGSNPGTRSSSGHTHPLMTADVSKLQQEVAAPATFTFNGHINCDSCHRPHGALPDGGYYILEMIESANKDPKMIHPVIDFTSLCHLCHDPNKY